jgi:stage II sporulation protein D
VRFRIASLALLALVVASALGATAHALPPSPPPTATPGEALFLVSGRGYGHGVGMSQFGAFGMANAGYTYDKILAYYYTGTELGHTSRATVRVLLAEGRRAATISSTVPFTVVDATGTVERIPAGSLLLGPDLKLPAAAGGPPGPAPGPLLVRPGKRVPLALDGHAYRGRLEVTSQGGFLRVVNVVALEPYLQGVVAGEMPQAWPSAALEAQAVAARSYALANLVKNKPFDLYADERSQVYAGVGGEKPRTSAAVAATAGQIVLYGGKVASTLYFSSSGGRTASALDVFGVAVPYLVSRPDPWDSASPYHTWGPILFGARTVQAKLGINARVLDATGVPTPSGRLRSLALTTAAGPTTVPSALLRTALGLRSTWITIGVLRLDQPLAPVVFGSSLRLVGLARGVSSPTLTSSTDGVVWTTAGALRADPTGAVAVVVRPQQTTRYRIETKSASSPTLLVRVAPLVRMSNPVDTSELVGTVRPRLSGAPVTFERLGPSGWASIARTVIDGSGGFRATVPLQPGSYRARVPATGGFAEGVTAVLQVTG